jgi:acyl carrier protein
MRRGGKLCLLLSTVERSLAGHPGVEDAIVVALPDDQGHEIVAVVVLRETCGVFDLRDDLSTLVGRLGCCVEPTVLAVSELAASDGLLDEDWLRKELASSPSAFRYEAPVTEFEASLAACLARALGRPRVGVLDDFVELGGDSLIAINFLASVHQQFGVELTMVEWFSQGTVRRGARLLEPRRQPLARGYGGDL